MKAPIRFKKSNVLVAIFYFCLIIITILSIIPDDEEYGVGIPKLTESGFFLHVAAYLAASLLGFLAYRSSLIKIIIFMMLYSTFLEWLQRYIPMRSFNYWDIVANLTGLLVAVLVYLLVTSNYSYKIALLMFYFSQGCYFIIRTT